MTQLNRRDVIRVAAASAAVAGGVRATTADRSAPGVAPANLKRHAAVANLRGCGLPASLQGLSPLVAAEVGMCRSWSRDVLLMLRNGCTGLVALDAQGLALAAAAAAAKAPLYVRVWGHDPAAELGLGRFAGALLALDAVDLADLEPRLEA